MTAAQTVERWWTALRAQGVAVDPDQLGAAVKVADVLERASRSDRLFATVQGILAKNERDLKLLEAIAQPDRPDGALVLPAEHRGRRERRLGWSALAAAIATIVVAALSLAIWYAWRPQPVVVEAPPLDLTTSPPLPVQGGGLRVVNRVETRSLRTESPAPPLPATVRVAILSVSTLLVLALFVWWRSRRPDWTRLAPETAEDRLHNNLPEAEEPNLFQSGALRSLGRALTGRTGELAGAIDVRKTVEATAREAGLLQIVEERPLVDSPIHFAIERRSREDHVGELYFRLADRLRAYGAYVQVTHYRDDLGSRLDESGRQVGAPRPEPWQGRALFVAVGDGNGLFDPLGSDPKLAQLRHVRKWPHKALLSTRPVILWGDREERLSESAMGVAPATSRGLGALADRLWREEAVTGLLAVRSVTWSQGPAAGPRRRPAPAASGQAEGEGGGSSGPGG